MEETERQYIGQARLLDLIRCLLDWIGNPAHDDKFLIRIKDRVGGARVMISRLPHRARIDHVERVGVKFHGIFGFIFANLSERPYAAAR